MLAFFSNLALFFLVEVMFIKFPFHCVRSLPLLLPAVEDGIFNDSWRIRQSSVELLGDLLFKVCIHSSLYLLYLLEWKFGYSYHLV